MSKKYVIDLPDDAQYILINGASENHCYTRVEQVDDLEELNSDYINEHFGELQDEAYKQGYAEAERIWRAPSSDNEFYQKGFEDGKKSVSEPDRIEVGDEVRNKVNGLIYIVTLASECGYVLLDSGGNCATSCVTNSFEKTGKHYDIASILEAMRTHD